jgi:hypothetical protein
MRGGGPFKPLPVEDDLEDFDDLESLPYNIRMF